MRWRGSRQSQNVEDRRGRSAMPLGRLPIGGGMGILVILAVAWIAGFNPLEILSLLTGSGGTSMTEQYDTQPVPGTPEEEEAREFVSVVLADTEDVWNALFTEMGLQYQAPTLVLYTGAVQSACGFAQAAVGPFYCPADGKAYLDLGFFDELSQRFGAPGDFAQAYVISHEIGHHVQNLLGIADEVNAQRQAMGEAEYNELSVRMELQADFLAGVWAHHAQRMRNILEPGDVEEALNAATQIGDDTLQRRSQGYVVPDAFTHGSSEQRMRWFRLGLETGDIRQGDTFNASRL